MPVATITKNIFIAFIPQYLNGSFISRIKAIKTGYCLSLFPEVWSGFNYPEIVFRWGNSILLIMSSMIKND
jgi:hypothetical protein